MAKIVDCPKCGEGDERPLGPVVCGLCECRFIVTKYGTKVDRAFYRRSETTPQEQR